MNVELLLTGKTDSDPVRRLVDMYGERLGHYCRFGVTVIPDLKSTRSLDRPAQRRQEGERILKALAPGDHVVLLDERGDELDSEGFANYISGRINAATRRLVFVVGGPYGFSPDVYARADGRLSLSRMTFSHQLVRALFAEQLYRAFTIIAGQPYHHR